MLGLGLPNGCGIFYVGTLEFLLIIAFLSAEI
jgi:hypothetical protein